MPELNGLVSKISTTQLIPEVSTDILYKNVYDGSKNKQENQLRYMNTAAFILHFLIAISIIIIPNIVQKNIKLDGIPTSTYTLQPVFEVQKGQLKERKLIAKEVHKGVSLPVLIATFSFITAGFHFGLAGIKPIRDKYNLDLRSGTNVFRWVEYSITASIMITIIALSLGLRESNSLILINVLNSTIMLFGYLVEKCLKNKNKKGALFFTFLGWVGLLAIWSILAQTAVNATGGLISAATNNEETIEQPSGVPVPTYIDSIVESSSKDQNTTKTKTDFNTTEFNTFIWVILVTLFVFFTSFGVVQLIQVSKNASSNIHNYEKSYIVLSFTSKATLVGIMYWGLYGRSNGR